MDVDEDEDEDRLKLPQKEARNALSPLVEEMKAILEAYLQNAANTWYKDLKTCIELIGRIADNIKVRKDLLDRAELQEAFICPSQHELPEGFNLALLDIKFKDLEVHRDAIVRHGLGLVAPSAYCLQRAYLSYQLDSRTAVRAGCPGPYPLPLELFHPAFRTFTTWAVHNSTSSEDLDYDEETIQVDQCVRTLQQTMPQIFSTHNA